MSHTTRSLSTLLAAVILSHACALSHATTLPVTSGFVLHLNASDPLNNGGGPLPGNGTSPTNWLDTSAAGNSSNFKNGAPLWIADGGPALNNRPVFRFDGIDDAYRITGGDFNTDPLGLHGVATAATIITVINPKGNNVDGADRWFGHTNGRAFGHQGGASGEAQGIAHNSTNIGESISSTTLVDNSTDTHILVSTHSRLLREIFFDGVLEGTDTTDWGLGATLDTPSPKGIGAYGSSGSGSLSQFYAGDLAEVIVFNRALSFAEINQIGYQLQQKYGVDGAFYAVPEPGTIGLLLLGLVGCTQTRRRRR